MPPSCSPIYRLRNLSPPPAAQVPLLLKSAVRPPRCRTHSALNPEPVRISGEDSVFLPAVFALTADGGVRRPAAYSPSFRRGKGPAGSTSPFAALRKSGLSRTFAQHRLFGRMHSVQRLHRGDFEEHNFVMFHHASSSPRSPNNTGFYFPSCFILPRHRIGKWGKIWGNSRAVLNTHQMVIHYILYTPCFPVSNRGYDEKRGMPKASLYNRCSLSSAL